MKQFFKLKFWPVLAGLLTSAIIMMAFEYVNSFLYPLPENLDWTNIEAVQAFTSSLPFAAYILVLLGWIKGSFAAGVVTTYFSKEKKYRLSFLVGVILTLLGVINNMMIGHDLFFNIVGLPMFIIFTYLGHRHFIRVNSN